LKLKLTPEEDDKIAERPIDDIHAYECFSQARLDIWRATKESLDRAVQLVKNALDIIGDNELLYASLGTAYISYVNLAIHAEESYIQKAEQCLDDVFRLNPDSTYGHILKGHIHFKRWDIKGAVRAMRRGFERDPGNPHAILLPALYAISGKGYAARPVLARMKEVDPLQAWIYGMTGWVELFDGEFAKAVESFRTMHRMDPENPFYRYLYSMALAANRQVDEACAVVDFIVQNTPEFHLAGLGVFMKHTWRGEVEKALQSLSPTWLEAARFDETFSWHVAAGYSLIGRSDEALDWLENSVNKGVIAYFFFSDYIPWFENIRGDERFKKLMERVKYEWEHFEV
jgi:tetratricopeptide (TPR) repeat protein